MPNSVKAGFQQVPAEAGADTQQLFKDTTITTEATFCSCVAVWKGREAGHTYNIFS